VTNWAAYDIALRQRGSLTVWFTEAAIAGPVASFTGDGGYDRDDVYREVCQRHPDAAVIVPPRSSAVPSATAETAPTKRNRHLQLIAERGRMGWQRASGYNWRAPSTYQVGLTGCRRLAVGIGVYCQPMLQISAQTRNFCVLEALCSAAVT
jgi:hypothetical protein